MPRFRYHRSQNIGPFRVNLSRSGVGFSVGGRGFRTGVSSTGRKYTTFGLPGTGVSWRKSWGRSTGCALPLLALVGSASAVILAAWRG